MFSLETKSLFFYLEPLTILQAFSWMQTTCPAILSEVTSCRSWSAAHLSDTPTSCSVWCGAFRENLISFLLQIPFICTFPFDWRIFPKSVRCHQSPLRQFCSLVSRRLSALYVHRKEAGPGYRGRRHTDRSCPSCAARGHSLPSQCSTASPWSRRRRWRLCWPAAVSPSRPRCVPACRVAAGQSPWTRHRHWSPRSPSPGGPHWSPRPRRGPREPAESVRTGRAQWGLRTDLYVTSHSQLVVWHKVVQDHGSVQTRGGLHHRKCLNSWEIFWLTMFTTVLLWSFRSHTLSVWQGNVCKGVQVRAENVFL